jgi:hypothetical protein
MEVDEETRFPPLPPSLQLKTFAVLVRCRPHGDGEQAAMLSAGATVATTNANCVTLDGNSKISFNIDGDVADADENNNAATQTNFEFDRVYEPGIASVISPLLLLYLFHPLLLCTLNRRLLAA